MDERLRKLLVESLCFMDIVLAPEALNRFDIYLQELLLWNEKAGLMSVRSAEEIIIKHFVDSLMALPDVAPSRGRLLDLGSGGGFPGIPLKIALPELEVYLLEASRKKSSFLGHVIRKLSLRQAVVMHTRVEAAMKEDKYRGAFSCVISRAAFKIPDLLKIGRFFLSSDGLLIAMKGPRAAEEEIDIKEDSGWRRVACREFRLPADAGLRNLLIYQNLN